MHTDRLFKRGPAVNATAWVAVAVFVAVHALIATERVHRVAAALAGAVLMLLVISLAVLTAVTAAFVLHTMLHLEPSVLAMVGGLVLLALSTTSPTSPR